MFEAVRHGGSRSALLVALLALSACGGGGTSGATGAVSAEAAGSANPEPADVAANLVKTGLAAVDTAKIPTGSPGTGTERVHFTTEVAPASEIGAFRTVCDYSHMAFDDPIVYPGQPGRSHLHTFFGNTGANAHSTLESIRSSGNSTCRGGTINRSAYWVPTMIDTATATPLAPATANMYYKTGYELPAASIQPLPSGLRMVVDPVSRPGAGFTRYSCNENKTEHIPDCPVGSVLIMEVFFPQCWDGVNLDSPDHKSHMSGTAVLQMAPWTRYCPASHPVALPEIAFMVAYEVKTSTTKWRLSSDADVTRPAGYSSHGDWFNGWKKDISDAWVKNCNQASRDCHSHLLGDGRAMY